MVADACVNCHNSHPLTPRKGWKLGDVRGALEVTQVIDQQLAAANSVSNSITFWSILLVLAAIAATLFVTMQVAKPIRQITSVMSALSEGDAEAEIPAQNRADEVGDISRALVRFKDNELERRAMIAREQEEAQKRTELEAQHQETLLSEREANIQAEEKAR